MNIYGINTYINYSKGNNEINRNQNKYIGFNFDNTNNSISGYNTKLTNKNNFTSPRIEKINLNNKLNGNRYSNLNKYSDIPKVNHNFRNNEQFQQIQAEIQKLNFKIKKLNGLVYKSNDKDKNMAMTSKDNSFFGYNKKNIFP